MKYEKPVIQMVELDCEDVVCMSANTGPDLDGEDWTSNSNGEENLPM